jgi:uncharacterized membrane protein
MQEWLILLSEYAIVAIDFVALAVIVLGTLQSLVSVGRSFFAGSFGQEKRAIWLNYARWLIAGLTFQLGSDIIETSITNDWQSIVRVAAIAVVRTFLNYFLERDLAEVRERERAAHERRAAEAPKPA